MGMATTPTRMWLGDTDIGVSDAKIVDGTIKHVMTHNIEISQKTIKFGIHPGYTGGSDGSSLLVIVFCILIYHAGVDLNWVILWLVVGVAITTLCDKSPPMVLLKDNRPTYYANDIAKIQVLSHGQTFNMKNNTLGTLSGAAVGGILFGGSGAIVGAIASNNKEVIFDEYKLICIKFHDQSWVTIKTNNIILFENLLSISGGVHACPI